MRAKTFLYIATLLCVISSHAHAQHTVESLEAELDLHKDKDSLKAKILYLLTEMNLERNVSKALDYGIEELAVAQALNDVFLKVQAHTHLANVEYNLQNYDEAILYADSSIFISENEGFSRLQIDAYYIKGRVLTEIQKSEDALMLFEKCVNLSEPINYFEGIQKGLEGQGELAENEGKFRLAKHFFEEALSNGMKSGNPRILANSYNDIGRIHDLNGEYDKGLNYYLKGAKIAEESELWNIEAGLLGNVASLHYLMKDNKRTLEYAKRAVTLFKKVGNKKGEASSNTTIANVLFREGEYDMALKIFQEVYSIRKQTDDKRGLSFALVNLGKTYGKLGDDNRKLDYFKNSLQLKEELGLNFGILTVSRSIAMMYLEMGNFMLAENYAQKALNLALQIGSYSEITPSYELLAIIKFKSKNYKKAFEFQKMHSIYSDSLLNEEKSKQIQKMRVHYETERKENKILQQENDILSLNNKNIKITSQRNYIMAGSLSLALLSFFGYKWNKVRQERNDKREFAEALIFAQEEERRRLARDLHDGVGQSLLLIKKQLEATSIVTEENQALIAETLQEVRSISHDLHPFQLEKFGLTAAIEGVINNVIKSSELFVSHELDNVDKILDKKSEINLFRTIQEAFNNIIKHADANAAKITLSKKKKELEVVIQDNGKGFDHELAVVTSKSLGLRTMQERVSAIGGKLKFESGQNGGTIIKINIPFNG